MSKPMVFLALVITLTLTGVQGCCNPCHRPSTPPPPPPPGAVVLPPIGAVPAVPPPAPVTFPQPIPSVPPPPPAPVPEVRGFGPAPAASGDYTWRPGGNDVRLAPPVAIAPSPSGNDARLFPPETSPPQAPASPKPAIAETRSPPTLPVGIPQFAMVKDRVAAGLRPMLDGGLDWLQANGYRTVLHLRPPGEDDNADRKQVEKRGMKYLTIEVSPETLTRKTVQEFSQVINEVSGQPLFVYDRDGALAGGLWYLHFRLSEQIPDDTARVRASSLGLREDREGAPRAMWLAVQKLLSES